MTVPQFLQALEKTVAVLLLSLLVSLARAGSTGCTRGWASAPLHTGDYTAVWHITQAQPADDTPTVSVAPATTAAASGVPGSWTIGPLLANCLPADPSHRVTFTKAGSYTIAWPDGTSRLVMVLDNPPAAKCAVPLVAGGLTSYQTYFGQSYSGVAFNQNYGTQNVSDITFSHCIFWGCSLADVGGLGWRFDHCAFVETNFSGVPWGCEFSCCTFTGLCAGISCGIGNGGNCCLVGCEFNATQRGPFLQPQVGQTAQNVLILDLRCNHISRVSGADEWLGFEGPGMSNNVYVCHVRLLDCPGNLTLASNSTSGIWITDVSGWGGGVYGYAFTPTASMSGLVFSLWRHSGGHFVTDASVHDSAIQWCQWFDPDAGDGSSIYWKSRPPVPVFSTLGKNMTLTQTAVWRMGPMTLQSGFNNGADDPTVITYP